MKTLKEILDTELSADNMKNFTMQSLADYLVDNGIVETENDVKKLVIEGIQKAMNDDDEFPIHYYEKKEPMNEEHKAVDAGDCLTDEYIQDNLKE